MDERAILDHLPAMVWRAGTDARCAYVNATWLAFRGRPLERELGDGWSEGVHPEDVGECLASYRRAFDARAPFEAEYRLLRHDGAYRWILDRGAPYHAPDGAFAGYLGSCIDIDDRHKLDEAKHTFVTMIAHELRTPLMPLRAGPTLLRRRIDSGADVESLLANMERQVDRFAQVIDALSEVSRLQANRKLVLQRAPLDLWHLVRETVTNHGEALHVQPGPPGVTIAVVGAEGELVVPVDANRIGRVLTNLVDNAIKYSPGGKPVTVRCSVADGVARIAVADQGIGIPEAELANLHQRFFRASNASPKQFPGMGLGLAIVHEIVRAHGGELLVESKLGEGTTMTVTLPLAT